MKMVNAALVIGALILCFPAGASADAFDKSVEVEGQFFFQWTYNISGYEEWDVDRYDNNDAQEFELTRTYLGAIARIAPSLTARILLDSKRETTEDGEGKSMAFLKYAYLDGNVADWLHLRAGQLQTPWVSFLNWAYGYRFITKPFSDRYGFNASSDMGLAALGYFPKGYGSYFLGVYNGEGFKAGEINSGKAGHIRVSVAPIQAVESMKQLSLSGHFRYAKPDPDLETVDTQYGGLLHYRYRINENLKLNFGFEYEIREVQPFRDATSDQIVNSMGYSMFMDFDFYRGLALFARYDFLDPNTKNSEEKQIGYQDEITWINAGLGYRLAKSTRLAVDYQRTAYTQEVADEDGDLVVKKPDQIIGVHVEFKF